MKIKLFLIFLIALLFFIPLKASAQPPPFVYRIGGKITINGKAMTHSIFSRYHFSIEVTKDGNTPLDPVAETSELKSKETYIIDIPVKDELHPGAANPGEILEIRYIKETRK